jgi:osmotically-inducible protein OsmY
MTQPATVRSGGSEVDPSTRELSEILQQQLHRNPHADLRGVRVCVVEGIVRLLGRVPSFHAKQMAHIIVRDEYAAGRIENAIEVA